MKKTTMFHCKIARQIRSLVDFGNVKVGDIGGYIESEDNLPNTTDDKSWVEASSVVIGNSRITDSIINSTCDIIDSTISYGSIINSGSVIMNSVIIKSNISNSVISATVNCNVAVDRCDMTGSIYVCTLPENNQEIYAKKSIIKQSTVMNRTVYKENLTKYNNMPGRVEK